MRFCSILTMAIAFCLFTSVFAEGELFPTGGACVEKGKKRSKIDLFLCVASAFFWSEEDEICCELRDYKYPPCINEKGEYYCEGYGPACNECPLDLPAYRG